MGDDLIKDVYTQNLRYIKSNTTDADLLVQLAEEAVELAQAALKCRRALGCGTPTPVSVGAAWADVLEELEDVKVCADAIMIWEDIVEALKIRHRKADRWAKRLREERHDGD